MPCKEAGATFVMQKPATVKDSFETRPRKLRPRATPAGGYGRAALGGNTERPRHPPAMACRPGGKPVKTPTGRE